MNTLYKIFCLLALNSLFISRPLLAGTADVKSKSPAAAAVVTAHLFYPLTGKFDDKDALADDFILSNVIIGEGSASGHSDSTLVLLKINFDEAHQWARVLIHTKDDKKKIFVDEILDKKENATYTEPFLLRGTGCQQINIDISLFKTKIRPDPKKAKADRTLTKTLNFECNAD